MIPTLALVMKELRLFRRDPGGLLMLFALPAVFIVVLSVALQGPFSSGNLEETVDVLVVNEDRGEIGAQLIEHLDKTGIFKPVTRVDNAPLTRDRAADLIRSGAFKIGISIPDHLEAALALEQDETIELMADPVLSMKIAIAIEAAVQRFVHTAMINDLLSRQHALTAGLKGTDSRPGPARDSRPACDAAQLDDEDFAVQTRSTHYFGTRGLLVEQTYLSARGGRAVPSSVQQYVPGWTVFALFWIAQVLCLNIIDERSTGAYKRILVSPLSFAKYLLGKTIPFAMVNAIQALFMFGIGLHVLPLLGCSKLVITNAAALIWVTIAISCAAIGFGLLMASISKSVAFSSSITATILVILSVLGGVMVPKFIMPSAMQRLSVAIPHAWALDAYQDILVRNSDTREVLPGIGVLLGFAVLFFAVALIRIRSQANRRR